MSAEATTDQNAGEGTAEPSRRRRLKREMRPGISLLSQGEPMVWLTGGALVICLIMIIGLLFLIFMSGVKTFWPVDVVQVQTLDGNFYVGEVTDEESYKLTPTGSATKPGSVEQRGNELLGEEVTVSVPASAEVVEVVAKVGDVVTDESIVARIRVDGNEQDLLAGHSGEILQVDAAAGDTVPADAKVARIKTSLAVNFSEIEGAAVPAVVRDVIVPERAKVSKGDPVMKLLLKNGETLTVAAPADGLLSQTLQPGIILQRLDTPLIRVNTEGELQSTESRRLFRTGNYRITDEHFNWVTEYFVAPGSETLPEWAILVERLEWGRFYGEPVEFTVRHVRPIEGEEKKLADIVNFFDANAFRGPDKAQVIAPLREKLATIRQTNVEQFVKQFSASESKRIDLVVDDSKAIPLASREDGQNITEAREVWPGPANAWGKFEEFHDEARERFIKRKKIDQDENGPLNHKIEHARQDVRQAELDHRDKQVIVELPARNLVTLRHEIEALEESIADGNSLVDNMAQMATSGELGVTDEMVAVAREFNEQVAAQAKDLLKSPRERLALIEAEVAKEPADAQAAVQNYLDVNRELDEGRRKIKDSMDELTSENERYQIQMVTSSTETLFGVSADYRGGSLTEELLQAFTNNGVELGDALEIEPTAVDTVWRLTDATDPLRVKRFLLQSENGRVDVKQRITSTLGLGEIVRAYPANQLTFGDKLGIYFSRWMEFLWDDPREANSEGGVFPAIWGTVAMTMIMALLVVPFGVLAALYLREYAKSGWIVSTIRIAINNLAGVPSIVFGVFGFGFFCSRVGSFIDGGPAKIGISPWPAPIWFGVLLALCVVAVGAFFIGLAGMRGASGSPKPWKKFTNGLAIVMWLVATVLFILVILYTPHFHGFYEAGLPSPTFGKGGLLWASLTLALLTLPVVIVATEESLSAVPNSLREGSYASGASKWQTIRRIVLPHALPGIMTGMILAMARGAGEVAPLMLVGAKKQAPHLPVDSMFPYVHFDRSFMHLGFHIYDVGFQSQNSEASRPMVFTTTLLLIAIIAFLNLAAVMLRSRLRKRFQAGHF